VRLPTENVNAPLCKEGIMNNKNDDLLFARAQRALWYLQNNPGPYSHKKRTIIHACVNRIKWAQQTIENGINKTPVDAYRKKAEELRKYLDVILFGIKLPHTNKTGDDINHEHSHTHDGRGDRHHL